MIQKRTYKLLHFLLLFLLFVGLIGAYHFLFLPAYLNQREQQQLNSCSGNVWKLADAWVKNLDSKQLSVDEYNKQYSEITEWRQRKDEVCSLVYKDTNLSESELKERYPDLKQDNKPANVFPEKGYVKASPIVIKVDESIKLDYGYSDSMNNEHLKSAITTVDVMTPNKTSYTAVNGKVYPNDFPGATTTETGVYQVRVKRTITTTEGKEDVLYSAFSTFRVITK